jgi:hypothetical protein
MHRMPYKTVSLVCSGTCCQPMRCQGNLCRAHHQVVTITVGTTTGWRAQHDMGVHGCGRTSSFFGAVPLVPLVRLSKRRQAVTRYVLDSHCTAQRRGYWVTARQRKPSQQLNSYSACQHSSKPVRVTAAGGCWPVAMTREHVAQPAHRELTAPFSIQNITYGRIFTSRMWRNRT